MDRIITLIKGTTGILQKAEAEYEKINEDGNLRRAFHEAGRGLTLVKTTLERVKSLLQNRDLGRGLEDAKNSVKACDRKAKSSKWMFHQVALAPEKSRFRDYNRLLAQEGEQYMVEVLVRGMMEDVCELAKQSGIEETMQDEVEDLRDAINDLAAMKPSMPSEDTSGNFAHYGEGDQFNALGFAKQNNNVGGGNQFPEANFRGPVNLGPGVGAGQDIEQKLPRKSD